MKKLGEWTTKEYVEYIPPLISGLMIIIVAIVFFGDSGMLGVSCFFALIISVIPYFTYMYFRIREVAAMEDQFPNFLRDLVEESKSGMTLSKSIEICSRRDYGKLSKEIKKMHHQLTWGTPIEKALRMLSSRIKESGLIKRTVDIIIEAYKSGGNIVSTMESVASDTSIIKEAEKERRSSMTQHIFAIYLIYFMFIGIILALTKILTSLTTGGLVAGGVSIGTGGPCEIAGSGISVFICSFFNALCNIFALGTGGGCYYKSVFLSMTLIQGIFSGLVAGQIGEDSVFAGIKHSLIMVGIGFPAYILILKSGIL